MWHPHKVVNILSLILIIIFLAISVVVVQQTVFTRQEADEKNLLTFTASTPGVLKNKEFTIDVRVKKPETPVTGVYFALTYPHSKMSLVSIDTWNSAFDIDGEDIVGNGLVRYGRDSTRPLIGDQHVATLKFKALQPVDLKEITVTGDASIVSHDLKNIISQRPTITYVEKEKSKTESFFDLISLIITDFPRLVLK